MNYLVGFAFLLFVVPTVFASPAQADPVDRCVIQKMTAMKDANNCRVRAERKAIRRDEKAEYGKCETRLIRRLERADRRFAHSDYTGDLQCTSTEDLQEWAGLFGKITASLAAGTNNLLPYPDVHMGRLCPDDYSDEDTAYQLCVDGSVGGAKDSTDGDTNLANCVDHADDPHCEFPECLTDLQKTLQIRWTEKATEGVGTGTIALVKNLREMLKKKNHQQLNPDTPQELENLLLLNGAVGGMKEIFLTHRERAKDDAYCKKLKKEGAVEPIECDRPVTGAVGVGTEFHKFPLCQGLLPKDKGNLVGIYASDTDTHRCNLPFSWKNTAGMTSMCVSGKALTRCRPVRDSRLFYNIVSRKVHGPVTADDTKYMYGGCIEKFTLPARPILGPLASRLRWHTKEEWHAKDWMMGCHAQWFQYTEDLRQELEEEKIEVPEVLNCQKGVEPGSEVSKVGAWKKVFTDAGLDFPQFEGVPGYAFYHQPNMEKYIVMYYQPFADKNGNYGGCAYSFNTLQEEKLASAVHEVGHYQSYMALIRDGTCFDPDDVPHRGGALQKLKRCEPTAQSTSNENHMCRAEAGVDGG